MTSVLDGPRREIRRIFHQGNPRWVSVADDGAELLLPGDIVLTGTPANSRPMNIGDVVEVEVTGVGKLTNTVAQCPAPMHLVGHQPTASDDVVRVARGGDWWAERDAERVLAAVAAERN